MSQKTTESQKMKLQNMNCKTMVFTVTDSENGDKPIVYAQLTSDKAKKDQNIAEKLISDYAQEFFEDCDDSYIMKELEDLAFRMRTDGYAWFGEEYCFELTEVNG